MNKQVNEGQFLSSNLALVLYRVYGFIKARFAYLQPVLKLEFSDHWD